MLCATMHFPLGVYHALGASTVGADARRAPEWPPSPVRLIGALLDAAHGQPGGAADPAIDVVQRLAGATAPVIVAPRAATDPADDDEVAVLRGASQWAPRNPAKAEITGGLSLRDLAGPRAAVDKGGVAIGDGQVVFVWEDLTLTANELTTLGTLAEDVAWLGTSRSPVLLRFTTGPLPDSGVRWRALRPGAARRADCQVRISTGRTVEAFDVEYARRRASKDRPEASGLQKPASAGVTVSYAADDTDDPPIHDPEHWGQAYVLELDAASEVRPKAAATYLVARAVRRALLAQFGEAGSAEEAPLLLRGRGATPHAAFVPLPFVGSRRADGTIKGVAVLLPHPRRLHGDLTGADTVAGAIRRLLDDGADRPGTVTLLGKGTIRLRDYDPVRRPLATLDVQRYARPSACWTTVTPVVHSHWRSAKSEQALIDQVVADCVHVGLPAPARVEVLRNPDLRAAPSAFIDRRGLRDDWLGPLRGPTQHLRITFAEAVRGPILIGRARHFGLGLMLPWQEGER